MKTPVLTKSEIQGLERELKTTEPFVVRFIKSHFGDYADREYEQHGDELNSDEYWERNCVMILILLEYFEV